MNKLHPSLEKGNGKAQLICTSNGSQMPSSGKLPSLSHPKVSLSAAPEAAQGHLSRGDIITASLSQQRPLRAGSHGSLLLEETQPWMLWERRGG